ncbi:splicing factor u2af large subunit a [Nicotiana attenuata]|uniref:Splicing factor u2af large subunit a n=2 Tax=Nicotiana attenuata TaxID=49451 RepID=A0A1J6I879_NICAT|nr:splicing factor u2af large subunit a [Nicotiana attenuata]
MIEIEIGMRDIDIGQSLMRESERKVIDTGTRIERKEIDTGQNPMTKIERKGVDTDLTQGENLVIDQDHVLDLALVHAPKAKGSAGLTWHLLLLLCYLVLLLFQATRHPRRVYVGGLPPSANEQFVVLGESIRVN